MEKKQVEKKQVEKKQVEKKQVEKKVVKLDETTKQQLLVACLKDKPLMVACGNNREQAKKTIVKILDKIESLELEKQTTIQSLVSQGSSLFKIPLTKSQEFRTPDEQAIRTLFGLAIKERFYNKLDRFKIVLKE